MVAEAFGRGGSGERVTRGRGRSKVPTRVRTQESTISRQVPTVFTVSQGSHHISICVYVYVGMCICEGTHYLFRSESSWSDAGKDAPEP